jgi:hypothetical protein
MPITDSNGKVVKPLSVEEQKRLIEQVGRGKKLTYVMIVTCDYHSHRERKLIKKFLEKQQTDENLMYCGISGDDIEQAATCVDDLDYNNVHFLVISPHCLQLQNIVDFSWESLVVQIKLKFFKSISERAKFRPKISKLNQGFYLIFDTKTKETTYISSRKIDKMSIPNESMEINC